MHTCILSTYSDAQFLNKLWGHVNEAVEMRHCEIFSYEPDLNDDPFSDGMVWQFNFFIFNKSKGRIVYFSCIAKKADMDESFDERTGTNYITSYYIHDLLLFIYVYVPLFTAFFNFLRITL